MHSSFVKWIAFSGNTCIASGSPQKVVEHIKRFMDLEYVDPPLLVFDAKTSAVIDMDLRGSLPEVLDRLHVEEGREMQTGSALQIPDKPVVGRPKLGVVAREVTLLPRHWEWLASQPGGASVTLRKLVEHALREARETDRLRQAQEATYRFMAAMAGNSPGFEEASRALFAQNIGQFRQIAGNWPADIRDHLFSLADAIDGVPGENG